MWGSVGASPTGPTSNGQPDVEDYKAGSMGEELSAPGVIVNQPLLLGPATATAAVQVEPRKIPPGHRR
jgi:hypothetical protein